MGCQSSKSNKKQNENAYNDKSQNQNIKNENKTQQNKIQQQQNSTKNNQENSVENKEQQQKSQRQNSHENKSNKYIVNNNNNTSQKDNSQKQHNLNKKSTSHTSLSPTKKEKNEKEENQIPAHMFKQSREEANKLKMNSTQYTGYLKYLAQEKLPANQETADKFIKQYQTQYSHTFNNQNHNIQSREEREQQQQLQRAKLLDRYLKQKYKEKNGVNNSNNVLNIPIELLNEQQLELYSDIQNEEKIVESLKKIIDLLKQKQHSSIQEQDNVQNVQQQQQILRLAKQKTQKEEEIKKKLQKLNKDIIKSSGLNQQFKDPSQNIVINLNSNNNLNKKPESGNDLLNKRSRRASLQNGVLGQEFQQKMLLNPDIAPHYKIKRNKDRSRTFQSNQLNNGNNDNINNKQNKVKSQFSQQQNISKQSNNIRQQRKQYTYTQQPKTKFGQY